MLVGILLTFGVPQFARAQTAVPHLLHYQSLLYNDGGELLPDGKAEMKFRVLDTKEGVLYEELQSVEVVNGYASAMVGNGVDPSTGAPTGGLSKELFSPDESRYLEVEVENYPASGPLEIVSVPYALYAEEAIAVRDGAVDAEALALESVTLDHFAGGTVENIAAKLLEENLLQSLVTREELISTYRAPQAATQIGVASGLVFSSQNDVQGVLRDFDRAIDQRQRNVDAEQTARTEAIAGETEARTQALATERDARISALATETQARTSAVDAERTARVTAFVNERTIWQAAVNDVNDRKLDKDGGQVSGNITVTPGVTVDGYDVGEKLRDLNNIDGVLAYSKIPSDMCRMSNCVETINNVSTSTHVLDGRVGILEGEVDDLQTRVGTLELVSFPQVRAWGRIAQRNPMGLRGGQNVQVSGGGTVWTVTFDEPMPSDVYLIQLQGFSTVDSSEVVMAAEAGGYTLSNIDRYGFQVSIDGPGWAWFHFTAVY